MTELAFESPSNMGIPMGDKLPDDCLISLTDIPPDFEKHLKLVAERVQAMMISVNEYNSDNPKHDGAIFLATLFDALNTIYCDELATPQPGISLKELSFIFSEGGHKVTALRSCADNLTAISAHLKEAPSFASIASSNENRTLAVQTLTSAMNLPAISVISSIETNPDTEKLVLSIISCNCEKR